PRTRATHIHALADPRAPSARAEATGAGIELYLTPRADPGAVAALLRRQAERPEIGALSCWSLTEAGELLDWLEVNGCTDLGTSGEDCGGAPVPSLCPEGHGLVRAGAGKALLWGAGAAAGTPPADPHAAERAVRRAVRELLGQQRAGADRSGRREIGCVEFA